MLFCYRPIHGHIRISRTAVDIAGLRLMTVHRRLHVPRYVLLERVKSGSSGLKSDGGDGREVEVSYRGGPEVRQRYESGDFVRTWRRLMCHALAEVVVLDFRGAEVQRYGGKRRHEGGLQVRGWET